MSRQTAFFAFLLALAPLQAQPRIFNSGAVNAASFLSPTAPGGAIARGSIFSVFGENLGPRGLAAQAFPLPTTLGGVQALIFTGEGDNFQAPLLYVSANQINAILPSNVPAGRHLLRVSRDGLQSNDLFIKVVEASFGLFFRDELGVPVAVGQSEIESPPRVIELQAPARPGGTVVLWGSGLGPIAAPDDQAPPATLSEAQVEVLLAGRVVPHSYAGRSACCAGLDQINLEIPADAPTGCVVPLAVRVNGNMSNHTALPITVDGSPCEPHLGFRSGRLELVRRWSDDVAEDRTRGLFGQPLGPLDPVRLPPAGSCMVWPPKGEVSRWFDTSTLSVPKPYTGAGAISLTTPTATIELPIGGYHTPDPPTNPFLGPGDYSASAPGGDSFPPFQTELRVSPAPVLEGLDPKNGFARSAPAGLSWFGGDPSAAGVFHSEQVVCKANVADGQFQVPPLVWANEGAGERDFAFGAVQSAELALPTDGPDHGLLVYREEFVETGDLGPPHLATTPVTLPSGAKIQAELAATASERARGLMQRPVLDPDKGMLFLFETEGIYSFWMLNTLVPLDIIWTNSDREILFINSDTPPCQTQICPTYGPGARSRFVLEIAAGEAARRGLEVGDRLGW